MSGMRNHREIEKDKLWGTSIGIGSILIVGGVSDVEETSRSETTTVDRGEVVRVGRVALNRRHRVVGIDTAAADSTVRGVASVGVPKESG